MNARIVFLLSIVLLSSACAKIEPMSRTDMYAAPDFKAALPDNIVCVRGVVNDVLDNANAALYPDSSLPPSRTYPFYRVKAGKRMEDADIIPGLRFNVGETRLIMTCMPGTLAEVGADYGGFGDHSAERLIAPNGQHFRVEDWQDKRPEKLAPIIMPIKDLVVIEAKKGTEQYEQLISLFAPYQELYSKRWQKSQSILREKCEEMNIPLGTTLSEENLAMMLADEEFVAKLRSVLFEDWFLLLTYPLMTPEKYGLSMLVIKVLRIPVKFWETDMDNPGYPDRAMTAIDTAAMLKYDRMNRINWGEQIMALRKEIEELKKGGSK
jgi:hypothetical protein